MITTKSDLHIDLEYLLNEVKLRLSDKTDHLPREIVLRISTAMEEDHKAYLYELALENAFDY